MKLLGYAKTKDGDISLELENASICFQGPDDAQKFAEFAAACATEFQAMSDDYDHVHFAGGETPDIIISRLLDSDS
jgi:hypothetical protein